MFLDGWIVFFFFWGVGGGGEVEDVYICVYVYTAPEHCLVSIYIYFFD